MNGAFYRPGTIRPMRPLRRRATTSRVVLGAALAVLLGGGAAAALAAVHRSPRFLVRRVHEGKEEP